MKRTFLFVHISFLFLLSCAQSTPFSGLWEGTMQMNGKEVDMSLHLEDGNASFSSNDLMILDQQVSELVFQKNDISFQIDFETTVRFKALIENNKMTGSVIIQDGPPNLNISFNLSKNPRLPAESTYTREKITIKSKGLDLSAEIYMPRSNNPHPAILLLHGSTTNLKSQYTFYADYFAQLGFEVMVYDKRGSGESDGNYAASVYSDLADDAISCLKTLKDRTTVNGSAIGVWGLSQGAMLLPYISSKTDIPAFLIAVSPEAQNVADASAYSDSLRVVRMGSTPEDGHIAAESHRQVRYMIRKGCGRKELEGYINENARKFTFMDQTGLYSNTSIDKTDFNGYYWSERTLDFYPYWKQLDLPALIIFGENDEYVDALKNKKALLALQNKNITCKLFPGANHVLKKSADPSDFDWPRITDGYLSSVENWLNSTGIFSERKPNSELNQVELMKKFTGTWTSTLGKDSILTSENEAFGNGLICSSKITYSDSILEEVKQLFGYDAVSNRFIIAELIKSSPVIELCSIWFTSENSGVLIITNPENAPVHWTFTFTHPDSIIQTAYHGSTKVREIQLKKSNPGDSD